LDKAEEFLNKARNCPAAAKKSDYVAEIRGLQMIGLEAALKAAAAKLKETGSRVPPDSPKTTGQK